MGESVGWAKNLVHGGFIRKRFRGKGIHRWGVRVRELFAY